MKGMTTIDGIDYNEVYYDAIVPSLERYNEQEVNDYRTLFTADDDERLKNINIPGSNKMQKLSVLQTPDNIKIARGRFQGVTEFYGTAYQYTWDWLKDAKASDLIDLQAEMLATDRRTIKETVLKSMVVNPGNSGSYLHADGAFWNTYFDQYEGVANPPAHKTNTFASSHTHYVVSGAAAITLDDFTSAEQHLREHGVSGNLVCFIHSSQKKTIQDLAGWTTSGSTRSPIMDAVAVEGWVARIAGWDIVVDDSIQANYVLFTVYDEAKLGKPVRFIEPNNASFRGLLLVEGPNPNYPLIGAYYMRFMGSKVFNRSAGLAMEIAVSGSYTNPTYYA